MNKIPWLHAAEVFDSWRIVPRAFLLACFIWAVDLTHVLVRWYMALPASERGVEASGFASITLVGVMGFLKLVYTTYAQTGRDWNQNAGSTTVASVTTQVTNP